jgi:hypothetical protein
MKRRSPLLRIFANALQAAAAGLLVVSALVRPAWAKKVSIAWSPIPGATQYEIQIERDGKTVSKKTLEDSSWSGDLKFGIYAYQIRAYDRVKRPGQWTEPSPLVVMPAPPAPSLPEDGKKVTLFSDEADAVLRWKATPGASKYRVALTRKGAPPEIHVVEGTELKLKTLVPGNYSWIVTAIVKSKGRVPASFGSKEWESKPSEESEFKIAREKLEAPVPSSPVGKLLPPSDGKLRFNWKKVDGAERYELQVFAKVPSLAQLRGPASPPRALVKLVVTDAFAVTDLAAEGQYVWKVRALANVDEKSQAQAQGPQSTAEFKLDKNASFLDGSGYVAFSTMIAPYNYQLISPAAGINATASSSSITGRMSGEYWFKPQWGVGSAFELTNFTIGNQGFLRKGFEIVGKYRINFGEGKFNWSLSPKLGFEERDYVEVLPQGFAAGSQSMEAFGAQIGLDLRKQFSERFSLGVKLAYFKPVAFYGSGITGLTSDASNRNISLGAQCLYWLNSHWGLGAGAYLEHRSISFTVQGAPAGVGPEQLFMDGSFFFGSVIYSFGR